MQIQKYIFLHPENVLFILIILLSFLTSFTLANYNLPLYIAFYYMWNFSRKQQLAIFFLMFLSIVLDFMFIIFQTRCYELKFSLQKYDMDEWNQ